MSVTLAYVAASANRFSNTADVSPSSSVIAFGSSRLLALWHVDDPNDHGISKTLPGHDGLITCVTFVNDDMIASADTKGTLRLWRKNISQWKAHCAIQAHSESISCLHVKGEYLITGSSDSCVKIWKVTEEDRSDINYLAAVQTIALNGRYPLAITLAHLPQSNVLLLAIGGTDTTVQLWISSDSGFVYSATLSGHEDWIRSLAFTESLEKGQPLILASGSQDATVRLWNIEPWQKVLAPLKSTTLENLNDTLLDSFEASLGDVGENEEGGRQISLKRHVLTVKTSAENTQQFSVTFDALLVGHEAGVTSLSWRMDTATIPTLLSTSIDSSVILWSPSMISDSENHGSTSIWINRQRFGDVGGQRLGGFVGGLWARKGTEALAWGWAGGFRRWRCKQPEVVIANSDDELNSNSKHISEEQWDEVGAITGHNGPVKGLDWSPEGEYLISAGHDQTTRIHAPVSTPELAQPSWHEIARPQVHGYDVLNVVFIDPLKFASIADEKVMRIFDAPRGFIELSKRLGVAQFAEEKLKRPIGANVPPLGLSNKAVSEGPEELVGALDFSRRPFDGELAGITLWPETEKIFGHGYESVTLGVSHSRHLLATACKATSMEHAVVRVYDTRLYKAVGEPLQGHILTVTRICFSPDDRFILTVSRDRTWRLFEDQSENSYIPIAAEKAHARIIWDCGWAIEGDAFATASRDKTVKIWNQNGGKWKAVATLTTGQPATAVAFTSLRKNIRRYLAVGLENGEILIYSALSASIEDWQLNVTIDSSMAHIDHIHRLAWRPSVGEAIGELASCSEDGTMRILRIRLTMD